MGVEGLQVPGTLSQIQRSSAHIDLQPIAAEYYNITNAGGAPVAGLLILLDRKHQPVRGELQLDDVTIGPLQDVAQRQAHLLIRNRYASDRPLPLTVVRTRLEQERISVPMEAPPPPSRIPEWTKPLALALLILVIGVGIGWGLNNVMAEEPETTVAAQDVAGQDAPESEVGPTVIAPAVLEPPSAEVPSDEADATGGAVEERIFETNDLPPSRNALPDLDVGQRVRVRPGYQVALRTEPGADAGTVLEYSMQSGMEATIINGPVWLEGISDTIVWWLVRLDDGTEAWVAANTSELTLLEPVP